MNVIIRITEHNKLKIESTVNPSLNWEYTVITIEKQNLITLIIDKEICKIVLNELSILHIFLFIIINIVYNYINFYFWCFVNYIQ